MEQRNNYSKVGQEAEVWRLACDGPLTRLLLPGNRVVKFLSGIAMGYKFGSLLMLLKHESTSFYCLKLFCG